MEVSQWAIGKTLRGPLKVPDPGFFSFVWMKYVEILLSKSLPTPKENLDSLSPFPVTFNIAYMNAG